MIYFEGSKGRISSAFLNPFSTEEQYLVLAAEGSVIFSSLHLAKLMAISLLQVSCFSVLLLRHFEMLTQGNNYEWIIWKLFLVSPSLLSSASSAPFTAHRMWKKEHKENQEHLQQLGMHSGLMWHTAADSALNQSPEISLEDTQTQLLLMATLEGWQGC